MMMRGPALLCLVLAVISIPSLAAGNQRMLLQSVAPPEDELAQLELDQDLIESAESGELDAVELALNENASVDTSDGFGWTALHYAAFVGSTKIIEVLVDRGADIEAGTVSASRKRNVFTGEKSTPLHVAAAFGKTEAVKLLLSKGANSEVRDLRGWTPLARATRYGHADVVQALIDGGADVDDEGNLSPLHLASLLGLPEVAEVLIRGGADIEAPTSGGETPVHFAAEYGQLEILQLLLSNGAEKDPTDRKGRKPVDVVCLKGKCGADDVTKIQEALKL